MKEIEKEELEKVQEIITKAIKNQAVGKDMALRIIKKEMKKQKIKLSFDVEKFLDRLLEKSDHEIAKVHDLILELFNMNKVSPDAAIHAMLDLICAIAKREKIEMKKIKKYFDHWAS